MTFLNELVALGKSGNFAVVTEGRSLESFATDKSFHTPSAPLAGVLPKTAEQVQAVVRLCITHRVHITPRGAGTGLEGGCIPYGPKGIVIDTSELLGVEIDAANCWAWVGAGVKKMALNKIAKKHGLLFGPDPASNPSVGGMVSTAGSGMSTLKYGTTRENVVSLKVVTAEGELVQTKRAVRKSSTGLDLTQLFCGSEGTLGIVVSACVKLHPYLQHSTGAAVHFKDSADAVRAVIKIKGLRLGTLIRCELLNTGGVMAANKEFGLTLPPVPTILMELMDDRTAEARMKPEFELAAAVFRECNADKVDFLPAEKMDDVWEARRGCLYAAMKWNKKRGTKILNTDVCVPIEHLAACLTGTEEDFKTEGVVCIICAHIADGNFHCMIPFSGPEEQVKARALETRLVQRALSLGGTVSGEHGVGIGKVKHLVKEHGAVHVGLQERIKKALDPEGLFNPGSFYPHEQAKHQTAHL